jgi:alkanesulfonate monooxygenase SsuD/methylene tetrahydromethanopterin reductase-like flavin-dependent oxidoreductase (luciferase family)
MYRERAREHGYEPSGAQLGWAMPVYVADTDERAIEAAGAAAESLFNVFLPQPLEMLLPPGYTSIASYKRLLQMRKALTGKPRSATMQGLMESGTVVCGSPRTVRDTISRMQDKTGLENIIAMMQFGTMPDHLATRNMELFASEVMPHFRN